LILELASLPPTNLSTWTGITAASRRHTFDVQGARTFALVPLVLTLGLMLVPTHQVAAAPPHTPIVFGYPYASDCPTAGYRKAVDRWGMFTCNCTSYVAWALGANGQRTDWFIRGAMDAWNWPHVARLGHLAVGRRPQLGSVAVWPSLARPFGHVAYVSGVEHDGDIEVGEYNDPRSGIFDPFTFEFGRVSASGAVFIYVPRRRASSS
jgi:surface antigen